jgi:hypothetical protein
MRKSVLPGSETGFLGCGGKSLHELPKGFASDELTVLEASILTHQSSDSLRCGASGSHLESPEPYELNILGLLDPRLDTIITAFTARSASALCVSPRVFSFIRSLEAKPTRFPKDMS